MPEKKSLSELIEEAKKAAEKKKTKPKISVFHTHADVTTFKPKRNPDQPNGG